MNKFYHSVRLDEDKCKGCINCIKRCPTEAIRVRNGKASINSKFCIDCGECIRICENHAKIAFVDTLREMDRFEYTIALPAPTLYSQFNNLDDKNIVLNGLLRMGFNEVFEVSAAAELVSEGTRMFLSEHKDGMPWISTACPTVVRLIRVRFPNIIEHLLPIKPPVEVAAELAAKRAMEKTGLPREKIGTVFISPCPSKNTYSKSPLGTDKSEVDLCVAIKEVYPKLLSAMKSVAETDYPDISTAGRIGLSWGFSGGEAGGALCDNYLAADGIENVIKVLEDLEDQKIENLEFVELDACSGGCVGGVLTVENPYLSVARLHHMRKYLPVQVSHLEDSEDTDERSEQFELLKFDNGIKYEPVFNLGDSIIEGFVRLNQAERLEKKFPGLDCGSCGAPTCKALAMDIVRGEATEDQCIYLMRKHIAEMASELQSASREAKKASGDNTRGNYEYVDRYIDKIAGDLSRMSDTNGVGYKGISNEG
ncbi:MAG: 4Fe-4S dicluster domain-containing protein [Lachnospiraceae bacterium]|nr:4Fe-4S dicluster domain-containing protein [Lachnospiraceae bacterium]